mgnify:CR=1
IILSRSKRQQRKGEFVTLLHLYLKSYEKSAKVVPTAALLLAYIIISLPINTYFPVSLLISASILTRHLFSIELDIGSPQFPT